MSRSFKTRAAVMGLLVLGVVACGQAPHSTAPVKKPPSQASQQWSNIANGFIEDYLRAQPFFAAQSGRHEFDGQLPDFSSHGIKREISRLHDAREQIAAVDPAPLEANERFDREYLSLIHICGAHRNRAGRGIERRGVVGQRGALSDGWNEAPSG